MMRSPTAQWERRPCRGRSPSRRAPDIWSRVSRTRRAGRPRPAGSASVNGSGREIGTPSNAVGDRAPCRREDLEGVVGGDDRDDRALPRRLPRATVAQRLDDRIDACCFREGPARGPESRQAGKNVGGVLTTVQRYRPKWGRRHGLLAGRSSREPRRGGCRGTPSLRAARRSARGSSGSRRGRRRSRSTAVARSRTRGLPADHRLAAGPGLDVEAAQLEVAGASPMASRCAGAGSPSATRRARSTARCRCAGVATASLRRRRSIACAPALGRRIARRSSTSAAYCAPASPGHASRSASREHASLRRGRAPRRRSGRSRPHSRAHGGVERRVFGGRDLVEPVAAALCPCPPASSRSNRCCGDAFTTMRDRYLQLTK